MSHTKPYIRKKAVLIMYKVFLKYPESLRPAFPRLKEKLEDPDPGLWISVKLQAWGWGFSQYPGKMWWCVLGVLWGAVEGSVQEHAGWRWLGLPSLGQLGGRCWRWGQ